MGNKALKWKRVADQARAWRYGHEQIILPKAKRQPSNQAPWKDELCGICGTGSAVLRHGPFGAFLACTQYPQCSGKRKLARGQMVGDWHGAFDASVKVPCRRATIIPENQSPAVKKWLQAVAPVVAGTGETRQFST
jgi:hypothetical protein